MCMLKKKWGKSREEEREGKRKVGRKERKKGGRKLIITFLEGTLVFQCKSVIGSNRTTT